MNNNTRNIIKSTSEDEPKIEHQCNNRALGAAKSYIDANRDLWDERARPHAESLFYNMAAFRAGATSLTPIEEAALGDVRGKQLLHLQCHFGQDSLSWVRKGAIVTGVDYSKNAIEIAQSLSKELGLPARFLHANIYDLPEVLNEQFDIVFTSYGVLKWLPDIQTWGSIVAHYLKPGGTFFIVEFHPFLYVFDYDKAERIEHSYFYSEEPITYDEIGSYAVPDLPVVRKAHAWSHTLGDIINSLCRAGLRIESLNEYPYSTINCFPFVRPSAPGTYVHATHPGKVPMLYSIYATKPY